MRAGLQGRRKIRMHAARLVHMEIGPFIDRIGLTASIDTRDGAPVRAGPTGETDAEIMVYRWNIGWMIGADRYTLPHFVSRCGMGKKNEKKARKGKKKLTIHSRAKRRATISAGRKISEGGRQFAELDVQSFSVGLRATRRKMNEGVCVERGCETGGKEQRTRRSR